MEKKVEEKVEEKVETADEKVIDAEPVAEPASPNPSSPNPSSPNPRSRNRRRRTCRRRTCGSRASTSRAWSRGAPARVPAAAAAEFADATVGPAPPEVVEEVELVGAAARSAAAAKTVAVASDPSKDAYDVLGAAPGDAPAAIKRAFWKLSLMVHPDKCDHPEAARAFDLAKRAHATLADAAKRAAIDDARGRATRGKDSTSGSPRNGKSRVARASGYARGG